MKIYKKKCPCKDCKTRWIGCHGLCGKYKEWKSDCVEVQKELVKKRVFVTKKENKKNEKDI